MKNFWGIKNQKKKNVIETKNIFNPILKYYIIFTIDKKLLNKTDNQQNVFCTLVFGRLPNHSSTHDSQLKHIHTLNTYNFLHS